MIFFLLLVCADAVVSVFSIVRSNVFTAARKCWFACECRSINLWLCMNARALETTWNEHTFRASRDFAMCAIPRFRYSDTKSQPQQRQCVSAKHLLYSLFFRNAFLGNENGAKNRIACTDWRRATWRCTNRTKKKKNEEATAHRKEWVGRCKFSHHMPCTHDARRPPYTRFESHKLPVGYNVSLALPLNAHAHSLTTLLTHTVLHVE